MKTRPQQIFLCNGACRPKRLSADAKVVSLDYRQDREVGPNVNIGLPNFVRGVLHLPDRILDLLEIAAYVFCGDRLASRGAVEDLEYHAWARNLRYVVKVRDFDFWSRSDVQDLLSKAVCFMTGDGYFDFVPQRGHRTPPTGLFDTDAFSIEEAHNLEVVLFSGGLDSLAGALELLESTQSDLCLVSHRSQPGTVRTQTSLCRALASHYPKRTYPYHFDCTLRGCRSKEETQRTRAFLYTSIAFAMASAFGCTRIFAFENGITALNFPKRQDMINARASRTMHPKTISLLAAFFSLFGTQEFRIDTPFLFKTKADIFGILSNLDKWGLTSSSVSCSRTFQNLGQATHCGGCSQCIDRRFAAHASGMEKHDHPGLYATDFIQGRITDPRVRTVLVDYIRHGRDFAHWSVDHFYQEMTADLADIIDSLGGMREIECVEKLWDLCRRHGSEVLRAITRIRQAYDDPFQQIPEGSLLQLVSNREYLRKPVERLVGRICEVLRKAVPTAFRTAPPQDEPDFNAKVQAIMDGQSDTLNAEYPYVSFACSLAKPDFSIQNLDLFVESKYLRKGTTPSKASEGIAADLTKYDVAHILFIVYDPNRSIRDDTSFASDFEAKGRCTVCIIR